MGGAEAAIAQEIEGAAVELVRSGFGDHVDHCASGASQFGSIGVGRDAEFLDYLVGKLVGRAVASASLGEKGIVIVGAIDQIARLITADPAESQIAIRAGSHAARVLGDPGSQESQVGEATPIQ